MSWGFRQLWTNNSHSCHNSVGFGARSDVAPQEFDINRFVLRSAIAIGGVLSAIGLFCAGVIVFFCAGSYLPVHDYVTVEPDAEDIAGVYYFDESDWTRSQNSNYSIVGNGQLTIYPDGTLDVAGGRLEIHRANISSDASIIVPEFASNGTWEFSSQDFIGLRLDYTATSGKRLENGFLWLVHDDDGEIGFFPHFDLESPFPLLRRQAPVPEHE
ncbi:MAG: hypothetical protein R3C18_17355 [Planctomycetaceae bacterium]